ncbi:hypothetical protein ACFYOY_46855 [Streptomyces sp. NPDC007875]|uniref:hypothetical protein n=1 Tax=Streptomyces sp. NPDC007875 TaxID=3364783 RepID=UPI0036919387
MPWRTVETRGFDGGKLINGRKRHPIVDFAVLAKRWRVERAISWVMRARRNVRDYERLISHSEAHLTWTSVTLMVRRLTRPPRPPRAAPHAVEPVKTAYTPMPIRIRMQPRNTIRLAPADLR